MNDKRGQITGFYLETLLLIVVFIAIILVLTRVFGVSRSMSGDAKYLTDAVCLAQNTAEAVSAADSQDSLLSLLDEGGNARAGDERGVQARYDDDMHPSPRGCYTVEATWEPADQDSELVYSTISVWREGNKDPIYSLRTAVFLGEVSP